MQLPHPSEHPSDSSKVMYPEYVLRISRKSKRIKILIKKDASCVLVVPYRRTSIFQEMLIQKAKTFLLSKSDWVLAQIQSRKIMHDTAVSRGLNSPNKLSDKDLKDKTLTLVSERLIYFNQFYNFKYNSVRVKKMDTRWGSCSRKGNLNFSHKLGLLKPEESDYVVVHELCHLGEFNHGPDFWKLVERTIPNYLKIRKNMRGSIF